MIKLHNISKSFGHTEAVKDLSLEVKKGEIFGFLGPNGAGKSTTIRMLAGILQPDSGSIEVDGISLDRDPVAVKSRLGYIPDDPFIYRYLTGREFLAFVGTVHNVSIREQQKRIQHLLKLFPTIDSIDGPFYTYSRGTRQKLVFMAALLHEPKILLIDEPMVGLDPMSAKTVKDLLITAAKDGVTIFLSTHTLSIAEEICDRVGIINHGTLIAEGSLDELRRQTKHQHAHLEELFLSLT